MPNLTPEEKAMLTRFVSGGERRVDVLFQYAIYFVPSLIFGLYGIWKADLVAVTLAYVVLFGLVVYLIMRQGRSNPVFRSAIGKLLDARDDGA